MEIPLSNQAEQSILESAQSGDYVSVARQLADAILDERPPLKPSPREDAVDPLRKDAYRQQSWQQLELCKSAEEIASEQGVNAVRNADDLVFPDWPEGESADDFIAAAKGFAEPAAE